MSKTTLCRTVLGTTYSPKRLCGRCKKHRPVLGGKLLHGARGFVCADCTSKSAKPAAPHADAAQAKGASREPATCAPTRRCASPARSPSVRRSEE